MALCDRADDHQDELVAAVRALQAGDMSVLRRLAELSTFYGRRVAAGLVDDQMAAEDVAQEALLEALATLGQLRQPGAYRAWFRLVVRKHAERHRRQHRPVVSANALESLLADETMSPEAALERSAEAEMVRRVLAMAPVSDRLLLSLKYLAEWPDAELARLMGTSEGALRKRLFDA
ncbi:MAG: sigma-70 family RNA polymerase sigma factor [Acidimicrobiaceae bacterium]|nr:sigma-70 family RNA polymerase sigma factor [Acidimicrobiaceae bacterium]